MADPSSPSRRSDSAAADGLNRGPSTAANFRKDTLKGKLSVSSQSVLRVTSKRDGGAPARKPSRSAPEAATPAAGATFLPGRFEDFSPSSSHKADDPATLFVLSEKQPPGKLEGNRARPLVGSRQLSAAPGAAAAPALTVGSTARKDMIPKRQQGWGGPRRGIDLFPRPF